MIKINPNLTIYTHIIGYLQNTQSYYELPLLLLNNLSYTIRSRKAH